MKNLNNINKFHNAENGFTLIELLMVALLVSILSVSMLQVISQIQSASNTAEQKVAMNEKNLKAYNILRNQLLSLGSTALPPFQGSSTGSQNQSGFTSASGGGIRKSLEVLNNKSENNSLLRFVTQGTYFASPLNRQLYGEVEARYYVDKNLENSPLVVELWDITPAQVLNQNNVPIIRYKLLDNVESFILRSFTGKGWTDHWDNPYAPKPSLIEMTIRRFSAEGEITTFRAVIPLLSNR